MTATPTRTEAAKALLAELRERFPVLADFRPLKLLVHLEVRAALEGTANIRIANALARHVNCYQYLKALANGGLRYNLSGEVDGEVTEEQQRRAAEQLKALKKSQVHGPTTPVAKPPPKPDPSPPPPPARPILKLKKPSGTIAKVTVVRKGGQL